MLFYSAYTNGALTDTWTDAIGDQSFKPADFVNVAEVYDLAKQVRAVRNSLIAATDYALMPDYPISADSKAAMQAYRTTLRQLPDAQSDLRNIQWPVMPAVSKS